LNLIWLVWVFGDILFGNPVDAAWWMVTAMSLPIFFLLYLRCYVGSLRGIFARAMMLAVLGLVVMPVNHCGGCCYIIFACAFFGFVSAGRICFMFVTTTVSGFAAVAYSVGWPWFIIGTQSLIMVSVAFGNRLYSIGLHKDQALRQSHDEVRRLAATAERERIGRDLHDLLGHTLSLIALKSELANKLFDRDAAAAKREMLDVERIARDALAQVRRAVTGIRAAGLAAELASAKLLLESNGVRLETTLGDVALPVEIETVLAMTVREAVTNIQRHARATQARVTLERAHADVALCIEDNGRGSAIVPGNGLCGMRERLATIGAQLIIESQRGQGTKLAISAPLSPVLAPTSNDVAALRTA
jgi:two-component system sensor histidine kinase DesK